MFVMQVVAVAVDNKAFFTIVKKTARYQKTSYNSTLRTFKSFVMQMVSTDNKAFFAIVVNSA